MISDILPAIGGVGLFLFGMIVLTDGLKGLAGGTLRQILTRFTKSPVSGAATGALTTAVIQSSSATTVAAVGFVGAGLLTFPQALGIIFGANIGTTITGWLVAVLGFKLNLGTALLPVVLIGALLRLFGTGRLRHLGLALAGFSLLFIGIDAMQAGMARFEGAVTPADFPGDTLFGRLQLVLIGIVITLITQSSSAGVATAMVALGSGAIALPQAAAMVIGMDVGTTFTAVLASLGGSTAMRRTGYAHVLYNVLTGFLAFALLTPFALLAGPWLAGSEGNAQIALVAFHTGFNALGVVLILGFTGPFARLVIRLVPERGAPLQRRLDDGLLRDPAAATDAAWATVRDITAQLFALLGALLDPARAGRRGAERLQDLEEAQSAVRLYVERIATGPGEPRTHARHQATLHALDHLNRLTMRCHQYVRIETIRHDPTLKSLAGKLTAKLGSSGTPMPGAEMASEAALNSVRREYRQERSSFRARIIALASQGKIGGEETLQKLDAIRWLHRVSYHVWRIVHHLREAEEAASPSLIADAGKSFVRTKSEERIA